MGVGGTGVGTGVGGRPSTGRTKVGLALIQQVAVLLGQTTAHHWPSALTPITANVCPRCAMPIWLYTAPGPAKMPTGLRMSTCCTSVGRIFCCGGLTTMTVGGVVTPAAWKPPNASSSAYHSYAPSGACVTTRMASSLPSWPNPLMPSTLTGCTSGGHNASGSAPLSHWATTGAGTKVSAVVPLMSSVCRRAIISCGGASSASPCQMANTKGLAIIVSTVAKSRLTSAATRSAVNPAGVCGVAGGRAGLKATQPARTNSVASRIGSQRKRVIRNIV